MNEIVALTEYFDSVGYKIIKYNKEKSFVLELLDSNSDFPQEIEFSIEAINDNLVCSVELMKILDLQGFEIISFKTTDKSVLSFKVFKKIKREVTKKDKSF